MAPTAASEPGLNRLPPQNLEAEQSVLGAVLLDNGVLPRVIETNNVAGAVIFAVAAACVGLMNAASFIP